MREYPTRFLAHTLGDSTQTLEDSIQTLEGSIQTLEDNPKSPEPNHSGAKNTKKHEEKSRNTPKRSCGGL